MRHLVRLVVSVLAVVLLLPAAAFATGAPALERAPINPDFKKAQKERAKGLLSYRASPVDLSRLAGAPIAPLGADFPDKFDLREEGQVTPVKDQNPYGTCWAFAALASTESCLLPGETWDFSEWNLAMHHGFDWGLDDGGNTLIATAVLTRWGGPLDEKDDPYDNPGESPEPTSKLVKKHVQNVLYLPPRGGALDNDAIKLAVSDYGAVSSVMRWPDSSAGEEVGAYYNEATGAFYYDGANRANHAVTIVGWDDTYAASNFTKTPDGDGAFLIKNSWGTGWGNDGYFWISYYDTRFATGPSGLSALYHGVESPRNYARVYQYDPLGWVSEIGYPGASWMANRFTAAQNGTLRAVGFYTVAPNTDYEVYTGTSLTKRRLQASGTVGAFGYNTIKLKTPVNLTRGKTFFVIVKLNAPEPGGEAVYELAVETPVPDYSSAATASPRQSYTSPDGQKWKDLTTEEIPGLDSERTNVCLKAYATNLRKAWVSKPTAPKTMRRGKAARVRGFLKPRHKSGTYPVRVYKERYASGKWRKAGYIRARASNYSSYSRYTASLKLGQRGRWRLRAFHPAGVGQATAAWSKGYTYVRVR